MTQAYLESVRSDMLPAGKLPTENLSPGWCLFHVRVKDRLPFSLVFLPDRGGVVGTGLVFSVVGTFNRHFVGRDSGIRSLGCNFVIADRERFHVPFLHLR